MGTGGMVGGGVPSIVNFELTLTDLQNFKWLTVGDNPIKISNWNNKIIKIAKHLHKILYNRLRL